MTKDEALKKAGYVPKMGRSIKFQDGVTLKGIRVTGERARQIECIMVTTGMSYPDTMRHIVDFYFANHAVHESEMEDNYVNTTSGAND